MDKDHLAPQPAARPGDALSGLGLARLTHLGSVVSASVLDACSGWVVVEQLKLSLFLSRWVVTAKDWTFALARKSRSGKGGGEDGR